MLRGIIGRCCKHPARECPTLAHSLLRENWERPRDIRSLGLGEGCSGDRFDHGLRKRPNTQRQVRRERENQTSLGTSANFRESQSNHGVRARKPPAPEQFLMQSRHNPRYLSRTKVAPGTAPGSTLRIAPRMAAAWRVVRTHVPLGVNTPRSCCFLDVSLKAPGYSPGNFREFPCNLSGRDDPRDPPPENGWTPVSLWETDFVSRQRPRPPEEQSGPSADPTWLPFELGLVAKFFWFRDPVQFPDFPQEFPAGVPREFY